MVSKPVVYAISAVAVALGLLRLVDSISSPSLDPAILIRNLATAVLAIALGIVAPILLKRFQK